MLPSPSKPKASVLHHHLSCDLVVIGGGLSGVCAAIAAARLGASVVLVQDRSVLGGNSSSEIKMHVVGADCHGDRPGARETGLIEEFRLEDAVRNSYRCYSQWDLLLYEKVIQESNITLLLNAACVGCEVVDQDGVKSIRSVHVTRHSTEDEFEISGRFFADCSGDGRLGAEAGADFHVGRESQADFGEPKALKTADDHTLGCSILITGKKHDQPQPFLAPSWIRTFKKEDFKHRSVGGYEYGYWWAEWGGHLDSIRDAEIIRHELLRISLGIWNYIKNSGDHPNAANWTLDWVGAIPGKRESRRFLGPHVLTEDDVMTGRVFEDQVAYGGWWIDLHPPTGVDAIEEFPCRQYPVPHLFSIPLRCLYSRNIGNLFFAGRNISATHVAFASTRVMATCAVMGQAVGTTAALLGKTPGSIATLATPEMIRKIQQTLLKEDAYLLEILEDDSLNLAKKASVQSSSEISGAAAKSVLNGVNRTVDKTWGSWAEDAGNLWESAKLPAWLELTWEAPQEIGEVHLTFCTGLERQLCLTPSDSFTAKMVRGPQPETVRDYNLVLDGKTILEIRGNYLRKQRYVLPEGVRGKNLRVEILATNGLPTARVFEIRVY